MGRNKYVIENSNCNLMQLSAGMIKMVVHYKEYAQKVFTNPNTKAPFSNYWQLPNSGWIKINFNAHIGVGCRRGLGIVCRDDQGCILLTGTHLCQANWNVETSEAMAARYGREVAKRMGFEKIHLEGDALKCYLGHYQQGSCSCSYSPYLCLLDLFASFL